MSGVSRSAMGKPVDMGALVSRNEKTRAVGNMNVNARGDILDSNNKIIQDNTQRVKAKYKTTVKNQAGTMPVPDDAPMMEELTADERELFDNDDEEIVKK